MKCRECGNEIMPGMLFCTNCGAKVQPEVQEADEDKTVVLWDEEPSKPEQNNSAEKTCPNCGAKNSNDTMFCVECGAMMSETSQAKPQSAPNPSPAAAAQPQMTPPPKKEKSGKSKLPIIIGAGAAAAAVLIAGAVFVLGSSSDKTAVNDLVYLKDNEVYIAKSGKYTPQLVTEDYAEDEDDTFLSRSRESFFQYTADGSYLFYLENIDDDDDTCDLYYKKAGSKEEGTKLESGINPYYYRAYSKDKILYIKDNRLYLANLQDKEKIASDVSRYLNISEDGNYFCWREYDGEEYIYYVQDMNLKQDKVKIKDADSMVSMNADYSEIYYISEDNLYLLKNLKDKIKIASRVERACMLGKEKEETLYYVTLEDEAPYTYYDLIRDNVKDSSDYGYFAEELRESLKEYDVSWISEYKIYSYSANKDESQQEAAFTGSYETISSPDGAETMLLYRDMNADDAELMKLSKVIEDFYESDSDVSFERALRFSMLEQAEHLLLTGSKSVPISGMAEFYENPANVWIGDYTINPATKELYMRVGYQQDNETTYDLYAIPYTAKQAECSLIINDCNNWFGGEQGVYYVCDVDRKGNGGTLYLNGIELDDDVYPYSYELTQDAVYYLRDINSDHNEGTLYVCQNGKTAEIAQDVAIQSYVPLAKGSVAYLTDYNFKKYRGDLYVFNGKKHIEIDTDVCQIMQIEQN